MESSLNPCQLICSSSTLLLPSPVLERAINSFLNLLSIRRINSEVCQLASDLRSFSPATDKSEGIGGINKRRFNSSSINSSTPSFSCGSQSRGKSCANDYEPVKYTFNAKICPSSAAGGCLRSMFHCDYFRAAV